MTQNKAKIRLVQRKGRILLTSEVASLAETHYPVTKPIACKWCGSTDIQKYGARKGVQEYLCNACGRKFIDKDAPFKKQTPIELIGTSLSQYYDGLSFGDIARHLKESGNEVSESTVYRWIIHYTQKALEVLEPLKPNVSDVWVIDETVLKIAGRKVWFWDVLDEDTRFLLASHLSETRTMGDVMIVMRRAKERAGKIPHFIVSDALGVYPDGIERIFGADSHHIQMKGITSEINTNLIERFHGTLKDRTKVLRGFKTLDTAELILSGFLCHYNFFRPHMTLSNQTPAEVAGMKIPFKTWTDFVRSDK